MRIGRALISSLLAALFCVACIPANATILHTWVSGLNGNDNACTGIRQMPCATFTKAMSLTSPGGTISVGDPGDFGPLSITQSVTIEGYNMGTIGFGNTTNGIDVAPLTSSPINVILSGLRIDGQGTGSTGIVIQGAVNLSVDSCRFQGFVSTGIYLSSTGTQSLVMTNSVINGGNIGGQGVVLAYGGGGPVAALDHVTIMGMTGYAVGNFSPGVLQVTNSVLTQSALGAYAAFGTISIANTALTSNQTAILAESGAKIRLDTNDIYDSTTAAIGNDGGQVKTSGTNRTSGAILISPSLVTKSVLF